MSVPMPIPSIGLASSAGLIAPKPIPIPSRLSNIRVISMMVVPANIAGHETLPIGASWLFL
jgi:hypothetical protein